MQHTLSIFSSCTYYQYILLTHSNLPYQHTLLRKVREQGISQAARERSAILERQLTIAQERLGAERGAQVLDSAMATEAAVELSGSEAILRQGGKTLHVRFSGTPLTLEVLDISRPRADYDASNPNVRQLIAHAPVGADGNWRLAVRFSRD